jgi:CBS domain-containing protein
MLKRKIGGLPIVGNGELVGIISTTDILRAFLSIVQATERPVYVDLYKG